MKITDEDIKKLARLARIDCSEEEMQRFRGELEKILNYVESLNEIDTKGVKPCNCVLDIANAFREDEIIAEKVLDRKTFLDNSPDQVAGMIRVPPVLTQNTEN